MSSEPAFKKETGFRHFLAAATYSWAGLIRVLQESAFRQEAAALIAGLLLFAALGAEWLHTLVFVVLMLVLFAIEAINTAIEELVDRVSPELSKTGKHAKDLGSFAVACLLAANALFVIYVLYIHLF